MNGNATGRMDQYVWPYLQADLDSGRMDMEKAGELVDCFSLKFNERAKTTEEQTTEARESEAKNTPIKQRNMSSTKKYIQGRAGQSRQARQVGKLV